MNLLTKSKWAKVRKLITPPYSKSDLIILLLTLIVLLSIPLTIIAVRNRNVVVSKADIGNPGIVSLINQYRLQNGLGALVEDQNLTNAACWMANDLAGHNVSTLSHIDSLGRNIDTRFPTFGIGNEWIGENISGQWNSLAQSVFDLWKNSPGHNAIMLGSNFTRIGIGRAYNSDGNLPNAGYLWYWVADFASNLDNSKPYQPLTKNCVSNEQPPPPLVDIKANGSDGPLFVNYNSSVTISWTSINATACNISPNGWTGTSGSQSSGNLTYSITYKATCTGEFRTSSDSVVVNLAVTSSLSASPNPCLIASTETSCKISVSWTTTGYPGVFVCRIEGTNNILVGQGLSGSSNQVLQWDKTYTFSLRTGSSAICGQGTEIKNITVGVYRINVTGGDVDCSGVVDAVDALFVLRYVAGLSVVTKCLDQKINLTAADYAYDGLVDSRDALLILRKVAGLVFLNPLSTSSSYRDDDADYMINDEETKYLCLNQRIKDTIDDYDKDGLSNGTEIVNGTNPCRSDPVGPAGYIFCAMERSTCKFSNTAMIAFGVNGRFNYKIATDSISCSTSIFGDPAYGITKACFYKTLVGPPGYTFCSDEWAVCSFSGTRKIAFGIDGSFNYKTFSSPVNCTTSVFGDPAYGFRKACFSL